MMNLVSKHGALLKLESVRVILDLDRLDNIQLSAIDTRLLHVLNFLHVLNSVVLGQVDRLWDHVDRMVNDVVVRGGVGARHTLPCFRVHFSAELR